MTIMDVLNVIGSLAIAILALLLVRSRTKRRDAEEERNIALEQVAAQQRAFVKEHNAIKKAEEARREADKKVSDMRNSSDDRARFDAIMQEFTKDGGKGSGAES